jgi:hypothetical protein
MNLPAYNTRRLLNGRFASAGARGLEGRRDWEL